MNFPIYFHITLLVICFIENATSTEGGKEKSVASYTATKKVEGQVEAKVKLSLATNKKKYKNDKKFTEIITNAIMAQVDLTPVATFNSAPFQNMKKYRKYSMLGAQQAFREIRSQDEQYFNEITKGMKANIGLTHDIMITGACVDDKNNDDTLEPSQRSVIKKVQKYMRLAYDLFLGVPPLVEVIPVKIDEANELDTINYPKKIEVVSILKSNHKDTSFVMCYVNEKALDKKYILTPEKGLEAFIKNLRIIEEDYTTEEESKIYLCKDYDDDGIKEPFVVYEYRKKFKSKTGRNVDFLWMQTYLNNKRVEIFDDHRLVIYLFDVPEDEGEERRRNARQIGTSGADNKGDDKKSSTDHNKSSDDKSSDDKSSDDSSSDDDSSSS